MFHVSRAQRIHDDVAMCNKTHSDVTETLKTGRSRKIRAWRIKRRRSLSLIML